MKHNHADQRAASMADSSRRGFLKLSAMALGMTAFGPELSRCSAASTAANSRLKLAVVGCGGQGRGDMKGIISSGADLVALCDPDPGQIEKARADAKQVRGDAAASAKAYDDYHKLLDDASGFDAVLIATPDHWHAPLCKAFMKAGKHIYCEKPLTHSVSEARELRELAASSRVVTQMGNQGSASASCRRCVEIIKAGALGQIREIYHWGIGVTAREGNAPTADPIPEGFNWDLWVGPSSMRPFSKEYHPFRWRGWFDFGNGGLADFCCHAINMPMRALDLGYPEKLVLNMENGKQIAGKAAVEFHFAARGSLPPVTLYWQGNGKPRAEILQPLAALYKEKVPDGIMVIGEKGRIYTSHWNTGGLLQLEGEPRMTDVTRHEATRNIPETLPRVKGHSQEWIDACRGQGKTFSPFQVGGKLTEIGLSAVVAIRTGKTLDWDGENMRASDAPEADRFIHTKYREKWLG
jgi:predicted dehydrogenase